MPLEFDVETTGLQPWSQRHEAFLWIFFDGDTAEAIPFRASDPDEEARQKIQAWFDRAESLGGIRAHNSKFDKAFAEAAGFDVPGDGQWHDSMIVAHVIDERRSVALKAIATQLFGPEADDLQKQVKAWLTAERARRKKAAHDSGTELVEPNYGDVPMKIMEPYALEDVLLTRRISEQYEPVLEAASDLAEVVEFERKVLDALYAVEKRGLPADAEGYRKLEVEVIKNLESLSETCDTLAAEGGIEDFNPKSTANIIEALKGRGADISFMSEKNGKLSADRESLSAVDDPLAQAILEFRSEFRVLSTYVRPMIDRSYETSLRAWKEGFIAPDGRIHANYRQLGARTGRMSCSDPNIQNQPRDDLRLRYNIVAPEGFKIVTCDLSNIEMRLFAAYAGEGALLRAVQAGEDLHALTAKKLGLTDRTRAGGYVESARQLGKTYNFSRIYGGGLRTIRRQFRCSMDDARLYKRRFDEAYPEVVNLQHIIDYRLADRGYIKSLWGRRFRVDQRDSFKAVNYLVQGTAADLLKQSLIRLHADGVPVIGLVHDEVLALVPEGEAEATRDLIIKRLTEHDDRLDGVVPLDAEGDIVDRWSQAKDPAFVPKWASDPGLSGAA